MPLIWRRFLDVTEYAPPGRLLHSSVILENKMYVFGGIKSITTITDNVLGDLWYLSIDSVLNNKASGRLSWKQLPPIAKSPSARFGHSALPINNTETIVFGGTDGQDTFDGV